MTRVLWGDKVKYQGLIYRVQSTYQNCDTVDLERDGNFLEDVPVKVLGDVENGL